jgi:hypothetical protein
MKWQSTPLHAVLAAHPPQVNAEDNLPPPENLRNIFQFREHPFDLFLDLMLLNSGDVTPLAGFSKFIVFRFQSESLLLAFLQSREQLLVFVLKFLVLRSKFIHQLNGFADAFFQPL